MDLGVRGKGYLVVGGTAGMGLATATVLAGEGAQLALVGRDPERTAAAAERLTAEHGGLVVPVVADVSREGEGDRVVAEAAAALDDLAGVAVLTGTTGHVPLDADDDIWADAFQDVVMGTVRTVRAALPHLVARGGGTVVTTSAYSIHSPHDVRVPYGSFKGAVSVFTKSVAKSHGKHGIRANCVAPGAIETEALAAVRQQLAAARGVPAEGLLERVMAEEWHLSVALGRPGKPREVGELISFLLSERAAYLTGALLNIDGGTDF